MFYRGVAFKKGHSFVASIGGGRYASERRKMRNDTIHDSLIVIVGGYIIYLGTQMIADTKSGASSMPMTTSVILCCVMCLAGLAVVVYGLRALVKGWKKQKEEQNREESETEDGPGESPD